MITGYCYHISDPRVILIHAGHYIKSALMFYLSKVSKEQKHFQKSAANVLLFFG